MSTLFLIIAIIAGLGTVVSLVGGLGAMTVLGPKSRRISSAMMRYRVMMQAIAVGALLLSIYTA